MDSLSGHILLGSENIAYAIERSARRKRTIALRIEPPSRLRISAPLRTSQRVIEAMLRHRTGWILRQINLLAQHPPRPAAYQEGGTIPFLGQPRVVRILQDTTQPMGCHLHLDDLIINLNPADYSTQDLREEIRLEVGLWLKKQARQILTERLRQWAEQTGLRPRRFILSTAESRWGSCDSKNVIRLSWRLVMLDTDLIDYVVVHELCHIMHKNHSAAFWNLVATFMPDHKQRRLRLKREGLMLP